MAASLTELLMPQVVLWVSSPGCKEGRGPLGSWLGFQPTSFNPEKVTVSGPSTLEGTGSVRNVSYRIFDHTRDADEGAGARGRVRRRSPRTRWASTTSAWRASIRRCP